MVNEIWKDIPGYEGLYQASNLGYIKSLNYNKTNREGKLKDHTHPNGYRHVMLYNNGFKSKRVHILVAMCFIPNPCNLDIVNHKNGDRGDCREDNLEWTTHRENVTHSFRHNLEKKKLTGAFKKKQRGKFNGRWGAAIRINNKLIHLGYRATELEAHKLYLQALKDYGLTNSYA